MHRSKSLPEMGGTSAAAPRVSGVTPQVEPEGRESAASSLDHGKVGPTYAPSEDFLEHTPPSPGAIDISPRITTLMVSPADLGSETNRSQRTSSLIVPEPDVGGTALHTSAFLVCLMEQAEEHQGQYQELLRRQGAISGASSPKRRGTVSRLRIRGKRRHQPKTSEERSASLALSQEIGFHLRELDRLGEELFERLRDSSLDAWILQWPTLSNNQKALAQQLVEEKIEDDDDGLRPHESLASSPIGSCILERIGTSIHDFIHNGTTAEMSLRSEFGDVWINCLLTLTKERDGGFFQQLGALPLSEILGLRSIRPAWFDNHFGSHKVGDRFSWSQKLREHIDGKGRIDCGTVFRKATNASDFRCELTDGALNRYLDTNNLGAIDERITEAGIARVCKKLRRMAARSKRLRETIILLEKDTIRKIDASQGTYQRLKKYAFFLDSLSSVSLRQHYLAVFPNPADLHCAGGTSSRLQIHLDSMRANWLGLLVLDVMANNTRHLSRMVTLGNQVHVGALTRSLMGLHAPEEASDQHPLEINHILANALAVDELVLFAVPDVNVFDAYKILVESSSKVADALEMSVNVAFMDGLAEGSRAHSILNWLRPEQSGADREAQFKLESGELNAAKILAEIDTKLHQFIVPGSSMPGSDAGAHPLVGAVRNGNPFWSMSSKAIECLGRKVDDPLAVGWFELANIRFAGHHQFELERTLIRMQSAGSTALSGVALAKIEEVKERFGYFALKKSLGDAVVAGFCFSIGDMRRLLSGSNGFLPISLDKIWRDPIVMERVLQYQRMGVGVRFEAAESLNTLMVKAIERGRQGPVWRLIRNSPALMGRMGNEMVQDVDREQIMHNTLLHVVCQNGSVDDLEWALEIMEGASCTPETWIQYLNLRQSGTGYSSVHYAVGNKDPEVLGKLVRAGADLWSKDGDGNSCLMKAAATGRNEHVKVLLEGVKNFRVPWGGEANVLKYLNGRTVPSSVRWQRRSALTCAIQNQKADTAILLIENNADLSGGGPEQWSALMLAAAQGQTSVVRTILESFGDPSTEPSSELREFVNFAGGQTERNVPTCYSALHCAYAAPRPQRDEIVALLMKAGADPKSRDYRKRVPRQIKEGAISWM